MKVSVVTLSQGAVSKAVDYAQLTKLRLATLVVFSALTGYFFATGAHDAQVVEVLLLIIGGFLVTGASNAFNQIIERDLDKLMLRTSDRPLPSGRMEATEALTVAIVLGFSGILVLWVGLNPLSGILGLLALLLYSAVYTPLKRVGSVAVFVGAFPGAIPPMLGYVAATGQFGLIPGVLFATQFIWQFPHFWAIAWKANEDYNRAGFRLLPSVQGKGKISALYIVLYTAFLIPISLFPLIFTLGTPWQMAAVAVSGIFFLIPAIKLLRTQSDRAALHLMLASFVYLPVVQILYLL